MSPAPRWRWVLFCLALDLWWCTNWSWLSQVYSWAVLPEWLGFDAAEWPGIDAATDEGAPF